VLINNVGTGAQVVTFNYETLAADDLVVEAVLASTGAILQTYTLKGTVAQVMSIPAPYIVGYTLTATETTPKNGTVPGKVTFRYVKDVVDVTVTLLDNKTPTATVLKTWTYEVPKGVDHTVYAPHVPGYVLMSAGSVTFPVISKDEPVTFIYQPISEVVNEYSVIVTVQGIIKGTSTVLYSYSTFRAKDSGDYVVIAQNVPGYLLESTSPVTLDVKQANITHKFEYSSLATTVTIYAKYDDGGVM
jgi:hypothetical protein